MPERFAFRAPKVAVADTRVEHPDALDETVVHDPQGRPWLIYTADLSLIPGAQSAGAAEADTAYRVIAEAQARYETQVYYTARAGLRGFPTGHGERYAERAEALAGHRRWCVHVRLGEVLPDLPPETAL